jgi:Fur family ferric uptake transcriptional regulator
MARRTRPTVLSAFGTVSGFVSAQQLHAQAVRNGESLGLATVYRELRRMVDEQLVDVVHDLEGEAKYRYCGTDHHHHIVCELCGVTRGLDGDDVERWVEAVATATGFSGVRHTIELIGTCAACHLK